MTFSAATIAGIQACCVKAVTPPSVDFDKVFLCAPVTGVPILVISKYTAAGAPISAAYNLDGTAYSDTIAALVSCGGKTIESDPITLCDSTQTTFLRWIVLQDGQPTGASFNTTLSGASYVPVGAVTVGQCVPAQEAIAVQAGAVQLAGAARGLQPAFAGRAASFDSGGIPGKLFSITVTAFESVVNTNPAATDSVVSVKMPDNSTIYLADGESRNWSIVNDGDDRLLQPIVTTAQGSAYATVSWTFAG